MKKILVAATLMLLTVGALSAQNTFRGIVRYTATSTGVVDVQIPAESATLEVKVFDNQLLIGQTIQNGFKLTQAVDFSQVLQYFAMNGIELESYEGDGKFLLRNEYTKEQLDSIYLPDTEAGHFYYEVVDETKDMFGFKAQKMIMHNFDTEGNDNKKECWFTTEVGPEYCIALGNMKGFPLVFTQDAGEGRAITYTCTSITKGKVSKTDMLLPAGFQDATMEEFIQFQKEVQDAAELLQD